MNRWLIVLSLASLTVFVFSPPRLRVFALLGMVGFWVIFAVVVLSQSAYAQKKKRGESENVAVGADGELISEDALELIQLSGRGTFATEALTLYRGVYRAEYQFPAGQLVEVKCIHVQSGEIQLLFGMKGSGSITFQFEADGRYALQIEPADNGDRAAWQLELQLLR
jgi:hypothetical protein